MRRRAPKKKVPLLDKLLVRTSRRRAIQKGVALNKSEAKAASSPVGRPTIEGERTVSPTVG